MKTDEAGVASGAINIDGEWILLVRHADLSKKVGEEFDESVFVSTLEMEVR